MRPLVTVAIRSTVHLVVARAAALQMRMPNKQAAMAARLWVLRMEAAAPVVRLADRTGLRVLQALTS